MKESIIVLGMHRSGTSVLAGLVSILGGYAGSDLMPPTEDNPKGYFENNRIVRLNEKILNESNTSWDDPLFTMAEISKTNIRRYIDEAKLILVEEFKYIKKFVIKDPRICILFPVWEQALKELDIKVKVIFVYRNPLEVANSLKARKRDGLRFEHGLLLWGHLFLQAEYFSRSYKPLVVEYDNDFQDLNKFLKRVHAFISEDNTAVLDKSTIKEAKAFYSPGLKHHKISFENISNDFPSFYKKLVDVVANKQLTNKRKLNEIRKEYVKAAQLFLYDWSFNKKEIEKKEILQKQLKHEQELVKNKHEEINQLTQLLQNTQKEKNLITSSLEASKQEQELEASKQELEAIQKKEKINKKEAESIINSYFKNQNTLEKINKNDIFGLFKSRKQKRLLNEYRIISDSEYFSSSFYLLNNPDVAKSGIDPLLHYCKHGWKEGRSPSLQFDVRAYLRKNPDVERAKVNPLVHYLKNGKKHVCKTR